MLQFTAWSFLTQICPQNSWCLPAFFAKLALAADPEANRCWRRPCPTKLHQGGRHRSPGALRRRLCWSETGRSPGQPGAAGLAGGDSCWARRQPPTMSAMRTAAARPRYGGASAAAARGPAAITAAASYILQVRFPRRCKHGHAFMASRAFRWMIW